jgi:hypothetical protein
MLLAISCALGQRGQRGCPLARRCVFDPPYRRFTARLMCPIRARPWYNSPSLTIAMNRSAADDEQRAGWARQRAMMARSVSISSRKSSQVAGSNPSATIRVGSLNGSWSSVWAVRPRIRSPPLYEKLASSRTTACSCSMFFQRHSRGNRIKVFSFRSDIGGLIGCFEAEHRAHGDLTGPNGYQVETSSMRTNTHVQSNTCVR